MCTQGILSPVVFWYINNVDREVAYAIGPNESRKNEKNPPESLFFRRIWTILPAHHQWLPNESRHEKKKKTYYGNFSAVLAFWVYQEQHQDAQIPYVWEPITEAELLVKHCCSLMCSMTLFWDQTIGSCNKPVISIFVSRQLFPLGEWKIALLHI